MEFPDMAKARQKPIYSMTLGNEPGVTFKSQQTGITPASDLMAGPEDDAGWMEGLNGTTGQGHTGEKVYWTYWSTTDSQGLRGALPVSPPHWSDSRHGTDLGYSLKFNEGIVKVNNVDQRRPMKPQPLSDLALNVCEATLSEGEVIGAKRVSRITFTQTQQIQLAADFTMNGTQGDYNHLTENMGITEDTILNEDGLRD